MNVPCDYNCETFFYWCSSLHCCFVGSNKNYMPTWLNPFANVETFDNWAKILAGIFGTAGVVFVALSWRQTLTEEQKKRLTFWERVCFIIGAVLFWVTLESGARVSASGDERLSTTTKSVETLRTNVSTLSIDLTVATQKLGAVSQVTQTGLLSKADFRTISLRREFIERPAAARRLSQFKGISFAIYNEEDQGSQYTADAIRDTLLSAGWTQFSPEFRPKFPRGTISTDVVIAHRQIGPTSPSMGEVYSRWQNVSSAMGALNLELSKSRISAQCMFPSMWGPEAQAFVMFIYVGKDVDTFEMRER
jgi:hypothetical protein